VSSHIKIIKADGRAREDFEKKKRRKPSRRGCKVWKKRGGIIVGEIRKNEGMRQRLPIHWDRKKEPALKKIEREAPNDLVK